MTASHELIQRGFKVTLLESKTILGGKSRSFPVPNSGIGGRKDLPAEHGFRFFPGFYDHVIDSMKRIPAMEGSTCYDNLVEASRFGIARFDRPNVKMVTRLPRSLKDLQIVFSGWRNNSTGLTKKETDFFAERIWQVLTSSKERSKDEYEKISWWEFVAADCFSENYQRILASGLTKTLVASKPRRASARTVGNIGVQLLFETEQVGGSVSRLLNGPTSQVWIDDWHNVLLDSGVKVKLQRTASSLHIKASRIDKISYVGLRSKRSSIRPDFVISCLPVEVFSKLISSEMKTLDPSFGNIEKLSSHVDWMNGIMFYLDVQVPIIHGHMIYVDSPWSLTSISQTQFWPNYKLSKQFGDGRVKEILSVNISNWDACGILVNRSAKECTREEIVRDVWEQLKKSLNCNQEIVLSDNNMIMAYLDPAIIIKKKRPTLNSEPLFVNLVDSWSLRPDVQTGIENLFLASDYVRTETDLATMEAANEAARRAVNALIQRSGARARLCRLWKMYEPSLFGPFRLYDRWRYRRGLPWSNRIPWIVRIPAQGLLEVAAAVTRMRGMIRRKRLSLLFGRSQT